MKYNIAEIFSSIQGEGYWCGTPMKFVRLAGCNVGKYENGVAELATCEDILGNKFTCDTMYQKKLEATEEELVAGMYEDYMCITGGEPFLNNLAPIFTAASKLYSTKFSSKRKQVHIETSGTRPIPDPDEWDNIWITCSPKHGFLIDNAKFVCEWKFLVKKDTDIGKIEEFVKAYSRPFQWVYLQPVDLAPPISSIRPALIGDSMSVIMEALKRHPDWRVSGQLHKYLLLR